MVKKTVSKDSGSNQVGVVQTALTVFQTVGHYAKLSLLGNLNLISMYCRRARLEKSL